LHIIDEDLGSAQGKLLAQPGQLLGKLLQAAWSALQAAEKLLAPLQVLVSGQFSRGPTLNQVCHEAYSYVCISSF
jgi:hypothetical protein